MRAMQSEYMHWAKFKKPVRFALTGSEVPHFRMDLLPISIADLDLDGASHPRYVPLRDSIAAHAGVGPERVVAADQILGRQHRVEIELRLVGSPSLLVTARM